MSRVFLILPSDTAAAVHEVIQARIDELRNIECYNPVVTAEINAEIAVLTPVAGQLKEPA
ncbi:hypothetical protein [Massilia sp. Leaf139]|uniref:hypothetical protein n=1 Tax=Massilia sp. Leaf139 TaxID=1736272 RepID=UPI0006FFEB2E|nr:hypothetical protein [Massilia sp. Leaf139]KQQ97431.1 hypothetical protein ASF77_05670 [Massilia sp. Leaf139]